MKRFFIISGFFWILAAGAVWIFVTQYLDPKLLEEVRARGSSALGKPFQIESLRSTFFPLGLELRGIEFEGAQVAEHRLSVQGSSVEIRSDISKLLEGQVPLRLFLTDFNVQAVNEAPPNKTKKESSGPPSLEPQLAILRDQTSLRKFDLVLFVKGLKINYVSKPAQDPAVSSEVSLKIPELSLSTDLQRGQLSLASEVEKPLRQRVEFSAAFRIDQNTLYLENGRLGLLGLDLDFSGATDLSKHSNQYQVKANIPDLSKAPASDFCVRPSAGSLMVNAKISTGSGLADIQAFGDTSVQGRFELDCKFEKASGRGTLQLGLATQFGWRNQSALLQKLSLDADATAMKIEAPGLFQKNEKERLVVKLKGSYQDRLNLDSFLVNLADLTASGAAVVRTDNAPSRIEIQIPPVDLKGFERFSPALASQPLSGRLEVKALVDGPLQIPEKLKIQMSPLRLEGFQTTVQYSDPDSKAQVQGPISANLLATVEAVGPQLKTARLNATADLSALKVEHPQLKKRAGEVLRLKFIGQANLNSLSMKGSSIRLPAGEILVDGSVRDLQRPNLNLKFSSASLDIERLLGMMPAFSQYVVRGSSSAQISVLGVYDLKSGVKASPLQIGGSVIAKLSKVRMPPAPKASGTNGASGPPAEPSPREPMFEDIPMYRNLNLSVNADIQEFQMDQLIAKRISSRSIVRSGALQTSATVGEVFGGGVQLKSLNYPLLVRAPTITSVGSFSGLDMDRALSWFSEDYKNLVKGTASGEFSFVVPDRSRKDFFQALRGSGQATVKDGFVSTLKFDQLANEKLSKIPGISKDQKVATGGARGNLEAKYSIRDGRANFESMRILTPERNELQGRGWVQIQDKTCDLEATVWLTNPPIGGAIFEANNDGQGRLKIPVRIKGDLLSPDLSIATDVIQNLLSNAARRESDKLKQKLSEQGQQRAKELGEDLKKEAEKKLQDLFK